MLDTSKALFNIYANLNDIFVDLCARDSEPPELDAYEGMVQNALKAFNRAYAISSLDVQSAFDTWHAAIRNGGGN